MAMPSVFASCTDAEAAPSSPGSADSMMASVAVEYAKPMPRPATAHADAATATGWSEVSGTAATNRTPAATRHTPTSVTARRERR
jgi:hypothetical protein